MAATSSTPSTFMSRGCSPMRNGRALPGDVESAGQLEAVADPQADCAQEQE